MGNIGKLRNLKQLKDEVAEHNILVHAREAPVYEVLHPQLFNWYHIRKSFHDFVCIFNHFVPEKKLRVLDLGCGTGFLTMKAFSWENVQITAVDLSKEMLSVLENKLTLPQKEKILLVNREAVSFLQCNTVKYDLIMTSALLHHIVDFRELVGLAVNSLKKDGILYIAFEPLRQHIEDKVKFLFHRAVRRLDMLIFSIRMKIRGINIDAFHEKGMADYQTLIGGGIDPNEIISCLGNNGTIIRLDKFAARGSGILAFIADRVVKSQNSFSIIFRKTS